MKKIYIVSLCSYDENNIPESRATVFVRSEEDLTKLPVYVLKENHNIAEALEEFGCESISTVFESSEEELTFYGDDSSLIEL